MKTEKIKGSISKLWNAIKKIIIIEKIELYPEGKEETKKNITAGKERVHYADFYHTTSEEILKREEERIFRTAKPKEEKVYEPIDEELVNYLMQDDEEDVDIVYPNKQEEPTSRFHR